jgi:hypothetical protein
MAADAQPGDMLVLGPQDPVPAGATVLFTERETVGTGTLQVYNPPSQVVTLVVVARR